MGIFSSGDEASVMEIFSSTGEFAWAQVSIMTQGNILEYKFGRHISAGAQDFPERPFSRVLFRVNIEYLPINKQDDTSGIFRGKTGVCPSL
jgi:hypothetical protein